MKVICAGCEQKYFCKGGWTGTSKNSPLICPSGFRSQANAHVSDEDKQIDRKIISICRGC
jgi:hypothetical protein